MPSEGGSRSRHRSSSKWFRRSQTAAPETGAEDVESPDLIGTQHGDADVAAGEAYPDEHVDDPGEPDAYTDEYPAALFDDAPDPTPQQSTPAWPGSGEAVADEGAMVSIQSELSRIVQELRRSIPELNGAMVASVDGLSVAHDFPEGDAERVAAMAATALGLGQRIADQTALGEMQETVVRGDRGYMVVYAAGEQAVLVLSGPFNANLGLMRIEARAASTEVNKLLG